MANLRPRATRLALVTLIAAGCTVPVGAARTQPVTVRDAWVRAPAPGQKIAAAYLELVSRVNSALVAAASPVAATVELHNTTVDGGVMKMRAVARVELPAGRTVKIAPGGLHIMLVGVKQPLKTGDKVPLTLTVQRGDLASRSVVTVQAEVRIPGAGEPHHR